MEVPAGSPKDAHHRMAGHPDSKYQSTEYNVSEDEGIKLVECEQVSVVGVQYVPRWRRLDIGSWRKKGKKSSLNVRSDNSDGEVDVSNSRDTHYEERNNLPGIYIFGMEALTEMCVGHLSSPSHGDLLVI